MNKDLKLLPGILQWKIGNKKVTVINDSHFIAGEPYLTHLPNIDLSGFLHETFRPEVPTLTTSVFLIEGAGHMPILIDTGMGNKLAPDIEGHLLAALQFMGIKPDEIGTVLLTHLHGDHFYGLINQNGEKNFPNAKIWVSETEENYWLNTSHTQPHDIQNAEDVRVALRSYERINTSGTQILEAITAVPLPGHTPGHTGFLLESEGEKLLFCGDIFTIPAVQAAMPEVGFATDVDYAMAAKTRITLLEKAYTERLLIAGPHFEFPNLSYVKKQNEGYQLIPKQWI
ncbi:MBL fold metallo-hydrolase [Flavobacterium psychrotrophum]|uniref:MBL fold metallo-hydrolase n=1 Tax=Flavobacterium psychrotrophum TaxID=2294119 RepID=UPI000E31C024|nr:MBL fold metallo-hydrolase [Flavobacterium psychrotrophum]